MSGFKFLAIRPLKGCDSRFRKNLNEGEVYKIYQDYKFLDADGNQIGDIPSNQHNKVTEVEIPKDQLDLYSPNDSDLKINISAIVGENGSGKSTLLELFFLSVYLIDYKNIIQHKIEAEDDNIENKLFSFKDVDFKLNYTFNEIFLNNKSLLDPNAYWEVLDFFEGLNIFKNNRFFLEFFYETGNDIYKLIIDTDLKNETNWHKLEKLTEKSLDFSADISPLPFYSICLNYSIHSLNTNDMGKWLNSIFHKNDAYQTPLVINPKREEGTIDIDNERGLQKSRLLVNTLDTIIDSKDTDPLFNKKKIKKIVFKYKYKSIQTLIENPQKLNLEKESNIKIKKIQDTFNLKKYNDCSWVEKETYCYISYKVDRIINNYSSIFNNDDEFEQNLKKMIDYNSHITFKLQQAINFINYDNYIKKECEKIKPEIHKDFNGEGFDTYFFDKDPNISIEINNTDNRLITDTFSNSANDTNRQINFLPPPIFDYDFHFSHERNDTFEKLSSGEKQQIYSLHTIIYHLRNVSSVIKDKSTKKYSRINILLDEIELYFHPEMQKHFINRLKKGIEQLSKDIKGNIGSINIILATHSPFILSDIPSFNILRLKKGKSIKSEQPTFGANIHNLLANDFFLKDGFMGEFAKSQIENVVSYLNFHLIEKRIHNLDEKTDEEIIKSLRADKIRLEKKILNFDKLYHKKIINLVGEPIIKNKLLQMYDDAFEKENRHDIKENIRQLAMKAGLDIKFNN